MMSYEMTWEDEDCNRSVQFSIAYSIESSEVKIAEITPNSVSFLCPESGEVTRTIGVHTAKGRQHLVDQFATVQRTEEVVNTIAERAGLLVSA